MTKGLWHRWFAWRPVCTGRRVVWLRTIDRRYVSTPRGVRAVYRDGR
jgi:hypothetical protein